ncbi:hypothetical protein T11_10668 [Trichinella zimbabwensis]|uniref:Uncharacterized protein n=1 Tax=Trichinella zimbabwensis TaxID=268475 RepID=A0A0V1HD27_9BILA|nr:hypothetical protein T11_10668 [Trichinella zimbabwensis]
MKLQKQPVGWLVDRLVGWLVDRLVEKRVLETGYRQNPLTGTFLAVNKKTAWAISRSAMRAYSIYQLAGTRREKERTGHRIECFYLQKQKRIRQKLFFYFLFLSQTYSLIDTAALESTEAQSRAIEGVVDRGCCLSVYSPPVTTMTSIARISIYDTSSDDKVEQQGYSPPFF